MLKDISVIILAGGRGTRIKALYPDVPKPLIPVGDEAFLYWVTAWFASQGLRDYVYAAGHMADQVERWMKERAMPGLSRRLCIERQPLGTGGGVFNCLDQCRDWVLVTNGDSLCLAGLGEFLALRTVPGLAGAILGVDVDDAARFGRLDFDDQGQLLAFHEKQPGSGTINSGTYLFRKEALENLRRPGPVSMETELIPQLLSQGAEFRVHRVDGADFIDIGIPETVVGAADFIHANRQCFEWS